jgi:hypothetical protein
LADLMKNYFANVIGKSEVSDFVQSVRKSLGSWRTGLACR